MSRATVTDCRYGLTATHPCAYLDNRMASELLVVPTSHDFRLAYSELTKQGFRRNGAFLYSPACEHCNLCVACRIPVREFNWSRRFRRVMAKNTDLEITVDASVEVDEAYSLFSRYIRHRHRDGGMFPPTPQAFDQLLTKAPTSEETVYVCGRLRRRLVFVGVTDILDSSLSAIYTFFDPSLDPRSLGTFSLLLQIRYAAQLGLDYVYIGYWVKDSPKMHYKLEFQPVEGFVDNTWSRLADS